MREQNAELLLAIKMKALLYPSGEGRGGEDPLCDPGSELLPAGSEREVKRG